ncbi:LamG-like jellyroll fold domain-containing protein [Streptomyces platensis]|uniref:LamG-like jellyroll fold domain-containing protein n=1 Tax=Streptomyces platensis TaxID=58346 RepID=UPI00379F3C64
MRWRGVLGRPIPVTLAVLTAVTAWGAGPMAGVSSAAPGDGSDSLVEDFAYPDRDKLLAEKGLKLVSGDGHITLVDCTSGGSDLVRVNSRTSGDACFAVSGPVGYLALEIKRSYLAKSDSREGVTATVRTENPATNESKVEEVALEPGAWKSLGEGLDPTLDSTVLELSVGEGKTPVVTGDSARPWLARVTVGRPGQQGGKGCSGALVDRTWVLTAASCFSDAPAKPVSAGAPPREATVTFAGKAPVRINYVVPRDDRDVLLARLAAPLTDIAPARIAGSAPGDGAALVAAGYGRTGTAWVPDGPHNSNVTRSSATDTTMALTGGKICKGDAGGPVLDGNGRITAVQSLAAHAGCLGQAGHGDGSTAARTDNIVSWLTGSAFNGKAAFPLDEDAGARRVLGGAAREFTAELVGGAEPGTVGKVGTALKLNGTSAYAATAGPVIDTTKSFAVSAWVKLDNKDKNQTFLSQAGNRASGFQLYYSKNYDKWVFNRHTADTDDTTIARSISTDAAQAGVWTHLTGVYDGAAKKIQLFVNGKPQTAADFTTPWRASGALQIGRLRWQNTWQENAAGAIDEVRTVQSAVTQADATALSGGQFPAHLQELASFPLDESAGATQVSGGMGAGPVATLAGGGGQLGVPGKVGTALKLNGTSAYAATAGPVIDTTKSFAVSAWVKLDAKDKNRTFLSQAGNRASGFQLYYSKNYDEWVFNRHTADTDDTTIARSISTDAAQTGVWTHLTGVYDGAAKKIQLFVNGKPQTAADFTTPWRASGALQIGRLHYQGTFQEHFAGTIDNIRIWERAIGVDEIFNDGIQTKN